MKNKLFTVYAKSVVKYQIEVNASSAEEAVKKAETIDAGEWIEDEKSGDFEVTWAEAFDICKLK
jgi:hypothetical protein